MDDGGEALIGLVGAHGDAFEFLEIAEEVLDQVAPFVDLGIDRQGRDAPWMLQDHDLGPARVEVGDDDVAVERLVRNQAAKGETVDKSESRSLFVGSRSGVAWTVHLSAHLPGNVRSLSTGLGRGQTGRIRGSFGNRRDGGLVRDRILKFSRRALGVLR
jgi:hypothetical protein